MTTPLRFCMVTTFYPPYNFGGDGITVQRLVHALAERGHEVDVVHCRDAFRLVNGGPPATDAYDEPPNVTVYGLESRWRWLSPLVTQQSGDPGLKRGALRRRLGRRYDVIHFHNASLIGLGALRYGDAVKLYTMHEHWLVCPMHVLWKFDRQPCDRKQCLPCTLRGRRPPQLWRTSRRMRHLLAPVDAFIAPSRFTREKHLEWGLDVSAPIVQLPNFLPVPDDTARPPARPPRVPYFLYAGRLERLKGVDVLIRAFRAYRSADLVIAGTGTDEQRLRRMADGLPHVRFLGHVPFRQLEPILGGAIAALVPSLGYEVFPSTVLEAFAHGIPVIANHLGPLPEMVAETGGGITYRTSDQLLETLDRLQTQPAHRAQLAGRARDVHRAHWTPEQHLAQYFELIASLRASRVVSGAQSDRPAGRAASLDLSVDG